MRFFFYFVGFCISFPLLGNAEILQVSQLKPFSAHIKNEKDVEGQTILLENTSKLPQDTVYIEDVKLQSPFIFEKEPELPMQIAAQKKLQWRIQFQAADCSNSLETGEAELDSLELRKIESEEQADSSKKEEKLAPQAATLLIQYKIGQNGMDKWVTVPLLGFCKQGPFLSCSPKQKERTFFAVFGSRSVSQTLVCKNRGDEPYEASEIKIEGKNASQFQVSLSKLLLRPQEKQEILITFQPSQESEEDIRTAKLVIREKDPKKNRGQELKTRGETTLSLHGEIAVSLKGFVSHQKLLISTTDDLQESKKLSFTYDFQKEKLSLHNFSNQTLQQLKIEVFGPQSSWFNVSTPSIQNLEPEKVSEVHLQYHPPLDEKSGIFQNEVKIHYAFLQKGQLQTEEVTIPIENQVFQRKPGSLDAFLNEELKYLAKPKKKENSFTDKELSRFSIYADLGAGFLFVPKIYQAFTSQGARYGLSSNTIEALGITRVGGSISMFPGYGAPNEEMGLNLMSHFEVGLGYIGNQANPFFQTLAGLSGNASFKNIPFFHLGPKIMFGYAYMPRPMIRISNQGWGINFNQDHLPEHFFSLSMSFLMTFDLDRLVKQKSWQLYVEPQMLFYFSNFSKAGFLTSFGFRHWF